MKYIKWNQVIVSIVTVLFLYGVSWIVTCGVVKLITICFGWTFKWSIATGIWLLLWLLGGLFKCK